MRLRNRILIAIGGVGICVAAMLFVALVRIPRVIAYAVAPDGTEMCVFQEFAGTEICATSFFSRKPRAHWGWFYYDHEDWPWIRGRIDLISEGSTATIYRGGNAVGVYNWANDTFTHFHRKTTKGPEFRSYFLESGHFPPKNGFHQD